MYVIAVRPHVKRENPSRVMHTACAEYHPAGAVTKDNGSPTIFGIDDSSERIGTYQ